MNVRSIPERHSSNLARPAVAREVLESSMDRRLKAILVSRLEEIRHALLTYNLFGAEPLDRALDSAVGSYMKMWAT